MRTKSKIALAAVAWAAASAALGATANFAYTGAAQTWTVPAGVTQVTLDLRGAQGGGSYACGGPREEDGGLGGQTQGSLSVTPGQVLNLYVGGQAADVGNVTPAPGGFNGGGDGGVYGAGGGGATDVRVGGTALANRVAVAGGGGGGSGYIGGLSGGSTTAGVQAGHGSIVITYNVATAPTPVPTLEAGVLALLGAALAALGAAGAARRRRG